MNPLTRLIAYLQGILAWRRERSHRAERAVHNALLLVGGGTFRRA